MDGSIVNDALTLTGADIPDNLHDIQGNIVKPYVFAMQRAIFLRIDNAAQGRAWLSAVALSVTPATPWAEGERPEWAMSLGISIFGLRALGVTDATLAEFPPAFAAGAAARAALLGETGDISSATWEDGFGSDQIHVAVFLFADEAEVIEAETARLRDVAAKGGVTEMAVHDAYAFEDGVEHFGYRDGLTDVPIEGVEGIYDPGPGGGTRRPDGSWAPIKPGEFLLGYETETGDEAPAPSARGLTLNGTFIVYRKIYQDVAAFRRFLAEGALSVYGDDAEPNQERLAAKMMGRWRSGCPLMHAPDADDPALAEDPVACNDFGYGDDPDGMVVPRGSHIRRMNPRDALDSSATVVRRHRILRRGLDYGPKLPEGVLDDDGADRGISAYLVCADIQRQFEFIWKEWVGKGDFAGLPMGEQDPIIGPATGEASMTLPSEPMPFLFNLKRFVTPKGGEYFLLPSLTALRGIAACEF